MSSFCCCAAISNRKERIAAGARMAKDSPRPSTGARRVLDVAGWVLPGGVLALLPKCPLCLAAYFAVGSGIAISVSAATYLRIGMILLCVGALAYLAVNRGRQIILCLNASHK